ncbi:MAG: DsbA family protein [Candidatus Woesearchaeota archaeon]
MDKETNRLKKELTQLEKTYKSGIINDDEYREAKKKIDKRIKSHSNNIKTEEKKKKIIKDIIDKPAVKQDNEDINHFRNKTKKEENNPIEHKPAYNPFEDDPNEKGNNIWSYLFLLLVIVLVLFFVYKYTDSIAPADKIVIIQEYSDFYCLYSAEMQTTLKKIKQEYGVNVKIYHMQFPNTDLHPMSRLAAEASECANEVNRFIEYHNELFFSKSKPQSEEDFIKIIESDKLDTDKIPEFEDCFLNHLKASDVDEDIKKGKEAGVTKTPTLVIDGELLVGAQPYEVIKQVIDKHLR